MKLLKPFWENSWRKRTSTIYVIANILIAFSDTISLSADILILSTHALIVSTPPPTELNIIHLALSPAFHFSVVTSSRCHTLSTNRWKRTCYVRDDGWQRCNNKIFVVTHITHYLSVRSPFCDNVTTKKEFFVGRRERNKYPLNDFSATLPASVYSVASYPRVLPRCARASPAVKHSAPPPEAWVTQLCCVRCSQCVDGVIYRLCTEFYDVRTPIRFKKCSFMSFLNRTLILSALI